MRYGEDQSPLPTKGCCLIGKHSHSVYVLGFESRIWLAGQWPELGMRAKAAKLARGLWSWNGPTWRVAQFHIGGPPLLILRLCGSMAASGSEAAPEERLLEEAAPVTATQLLSVVEAALKNQGFSGAKQLLQRVTGPDRNACLLVMEALLEVTGEMEKSATRQQQVALLADFAPHHVSNRSTSSPGPRGGGTSSQLFCASFFPFFRPVRPTLSRAIFFPKIPFSGTSDLLFLVEKRQPARAGFWERFWTGSPHRKKKKKENPFFWRAKNGTSCSGGEGEVEGGGDAMLVSRLSEVVRELAIRQELKVLARKKKHININKFAGLWGGGGSQRIN